LKRISGNDRCRPVMHTAWRGEVVDIVNLLVVRASVIVARAAV